MRTDQLNPLPRRLTQPVLVDAIFEIRFQAAQGLSELLPGALMSGLQGAPAVMRLPTADIPAQIRAMQADLIYQPLLKLTWQEFMVTIGDRSLSVACTLPYVGWDKFKSNISRVFSQITALGLITGVERFGFKYVDFLPISLFREGTKTIDWALALGSEPLDETKVHLRAELPTDGYVSVIEIATGSNMVVNGDNRGVGTVISTDVIKLYSTPLAWAEFVGQLDQATDEPHSLAKKIFFRCLTKEALDQLGPEYEETL